MRGTRKTEWPVRMPPGRNGEWLPRSDMFPRSVVADPTFDVVAVRDDMDSKHPIDIMVTCDAMGVRRGCMLSMSRRAAFALGLALVQTSGHDKLLALALGAGSPLSAAVSTTVVDEHKKDE